jgi:SAM-dependent methyltransferase
MSLNICKICGNEKNPEEYILKEMMFGTRDQFKYFKCSNCYCLQIKEFPQNIEKYYPPNYYSFKNLKKSNLLNYLKYKRDLFSYRGKGIIGKLLVNFYGYSDIHSWLPELNLKKDDAILDVGTGAGDLLIRLLKLGFKNLVGIDQFIEKDIFYNQYLSIYKKDLSLINKVFDLVMFHHVFEHLKDPHYTFKKIKNILKKDGLLLIRIPVIDSYAWEKYKVNWVQLDPPRHYFLHTIKSIKYLSMRYNFKIKKIIYDSTSFQFWGSEQYEKEIPLISPLSYYSNPKGSIFNKQLIKKFSKQAMELNKNKEGDSACFIIQN